MIEMKKQFVMLKNLEKSDEFYDFFGICYV